MKIKSLNILKRAVPALAIAIAISGLYMGVANASSNTIASTDISLGDTITISAGYYEDDTVVQIPTVEEVISNGEIPGVKKVTANYYTGGNNAGLNAGLSASKTSADVNIDGVQTLDLGISESVTMPEGYYFNPMTIRNNIANKGTVSQNLNPNASYTLPAGYYSGGTITANPNTQTYTFPANSTGATADLGVANLYRYVNATNVYNKGKTDGQNEVKAAPQNFLTATTYNKITANANTGAQTYDITKGYYNKVVVDQTNAYNAGVNAVKAAPQNFLTATTYNKITANAKTGAQTYDITKGYYNKVVVDQTNAYNAGVNAVKANPKNYGLSSGSGSSTENFHSFSTIESDSSTYITLRSKSSADYGTVLNIPAGTHLLIVLGPYTGETWFAPYQFSGTILYDTSTIITGNTSIPTNTVKSRAVILKTSEQTSLYLSCFNGWLQFYTVRLQ